MIEKSVLNLSKAGDENVAIEYTGNPNIPFTIQGGELI